MFQGIRDQMTSGVGGVNVCHHQRSQPRIYLPSCILTEATLIELDFLERRSLLSQPTSLFFTAKSECFVSICTDEILKENAFCNRTCTENGAYLIKDARPAIL